MDFLDPEKKRKHTQRLFIGYFLIGVAVLLGSVILLFQSFGYDVDRKTGQVIQNGLIFADAHPEQAKVFLNGQEQGNTDTRLTVPAGQYTVEMKRSGYRNWKKQVNLEGGSIERLVYPVLFPEKLDTKERAAYSDVPAFSTQSPDRRWIIIQKPNTMAEFDVYDANDPKKSPTQLALSKDLLSASPDKHSFSLIEWSTDNRHVLLKHAFGDKYEFIVLDRETPASSVNLDKTFDTTLVDVTLRDKKFDQYFVFDATAKTLRTAELRSKQITPLLSNILQYKSNGADTILYAAADPNDAKKNNVAIRDNGKTYPVRSFSAGSEFLLDITKFQENWYAAIGLKAEGRLSIYRNPMDPKYENAAGQPLPLTVLIMEHPEQVSFSANTRFIMTQSGSKFAVYDIETNRRFYYNLDFDLKDQQKAVWMDGHRMLLTKDSKVFVFEFDGGNQHSLVPIVPGTLPMFDRDYFRLYTLAPSTSNPANKAALTLTNLKLNLD